METQADLTPFQRMVLLRELEDQQEEAQANQSGSPGGGRVNSLRQPNGGGKGETITYVNDGPD